MSSSTMQTTGMKDFAAAAEQARAQSTNMTNIAMETNDHLGAMSFQAEVNKKINSIMEQSVGS